MPNIFQNGVICSICAVDIDPKTLCCPTHGTNHGVKSHTGWVNDRTVFLPRGDFHPHLSVTIYTIIQLIANTYYLDLVLTAFETWDGFSGIFSTDISEIEWKPVIVFTQVTKSMYRLRNTFDKRFIDISVSAAKNQNSYTYTLRLDSNPEEVMVVDDDNLRIYKPLVDYITTTMVKAMEAKETRQASPFLAQPKKGIRQKIRDIISQTEIFGS